MAASACRLWSRADDPALGLLSARSPGRCRIRGPKPEDGRLNVDVYSILKNRFLELIQSNGWDGETIQVRVGTLRPDQAIGNPEHQDYPIIKGREQMLEAEFQGARGHAFTDTAGNFQGALREIADMDLADNYQRAVFVAGLNAVMRRAGLVERTVHCRDQEPVHCAKELVRYVSEKYGRPRMAMVGLQPRMAQALSAAGIPLRITDLDEDNIGQQKFGITIEGRTGPGTIWSGASWP